jgi:hypothetical protein
MITKKKMLDPLPVVVAILEPPDSGRADVDA